jgi:hypothetical protein
MGKPTRVSMQRAAEKQAITIAGQALLKKYPPDVYRTLETEPEMSCDTRGP